jgi:hypothetical protein
MAIEGVDYAWSRPPPAGLAAAGKRFACRYLSNSFTGKNLTPPEAERLTAAGIAIVSNWEWRAGDAKLGYSAGVSYARTALQQALNCGMPPSRPIYFSVDWDATSTELRGPVTAYLQGVAAVLGVDRTGVYGGYDTIAWAHENGLARWLWQTYAWSGGQWHPAAQIQQYRNGVTVAGVADIDLDRATVADYGQWMVGQTEGDDMDAAQSKRLTNTDQALYALTQLDNTADFVDEVPGATRALPLVDLLLDLRAQVTAMHEVIGNIFHADGTPTGAQMQAAALAALQSPEGKAAIKAAVAAQLDDNPAT